MSKSIPRPLHEHTPESLLVELINGDEVVTTKDDRFRLQSEQARSALNWYRNQKDVQSLGNNTLEKIEPQVQAILNPPPQLPNNQPYSPTTEKKYIRLQKLQAHQFAGLHKYGTHEAPPHDYILEFDTPTITLLEGENSSGKTSLLNAIIWGLTGKILRPQRVPETAENQFICTTISIREEDQIQFGLTSINPLPSKEECQDITNNSSLPIDTWVELTLIDQNKQEYIIKRRQYRKAGDKNINYTQSNIDTLGIDPITIALGTTLPGLLPYLQLGSTSDLGNAVAALTGLSDIIAIAKHAENAIKYIKLTPIKHQKQFQTDAKQIYQDFQNQLQQKTIDHPELTPDRPIPTSTTLNAEEALNQITSHFERLSKINYDSIESAQIKNLESNIDTALYEAKNFASLPAIKTLDALSQLTDEECKTTHNEIKKVQQQAQVLEELYKNPSKAARLNLYAKVTTWLNHNQNQIQDPNFAYYFDQDSCPVCGHPFEQRTDKITGTTIKQHIHTPTTDITLIEQTLHQWIYQTTQYLLTNSNIPQAIRDTIKSKLPEHPIDLLRAAIIEQLFDKAPFISWSDNLKDAISQDFDKLAKNKTLLETATPYLLSREFESIEEILNTLNQTLHFIEAQKKDDQLIKKISAEIINHKADTTSNTQSLISKLEILHQLVETNKPVRDALNQCKNLKTQLSKYQIATNKLNEYDIAITALNEISELKHIATSEIQQLQEKLKNKTKKWHSRIYADAFPDTTKTFSNNKISTKGEINASLEKDNVEAPAQHIGNASSLRATIFSFFLAFREHMLEQKGGFITLMLDDPQDLLDDENIRKLVSGLYTIAKQKFTEQPNASTIKPQLILTSYNINFCEFIARRTGQNKKTVNHLEIEPATIINQTIQTTLPRYRVNELWESYNKNPNERYAADDFSKAIRPYFEKNLRKIFQHRTTRSWCIDNPKRTFDEYLKKLTKLSKSSPPHPIYGSKNFKLFVEHQALKDNSDSKSFISAILHGEEYKPKEIHKHAIQLNHLRKILDKMLDDFYIWNDTYENRGLSAVNLSLIPDLETSPIVLKKDIPILADLAAASNFSTGLSSQEPNKILEKGHFDQSVFYYLKTENFGFSAPKNSIAIVNIDPTEPEDRTLAIVRAETNTYARRIVCDLNSNLIGLTAEISDPSKQSPNTIFLSDTEIKMHKVIGIIFHHTPPPINRNETSEAVVINNKDIIPNIEIAFTVSKDSAVPLALSGQTVLAGENIPLDQLYHYKDKFVALTLQEESTDAEPSNILKRVGAALPKELSHLRQFESIGGLGESQILSIEKPQAGFPRVIDARLIIGVLYNN